MQALSAYMQRLNSCALNNIKFSVTALDPSDAMFMESKIKFLTYMLTEYRGYLAGQLRSKPKYAKVGKIQAGPSNTDKIRTGMCLVVCEFSANKLHRHVEICYSSFSIFRVVLLDA